MATAAYAQSTKTPFVFTVGGTASDVGYEVEGFQERKLVKCKGCVKVTASQNTQSLRLAGYAIEGTPKTPTFCIIHQCLPNGSGLGGGQISFVMEQITMIHLPALDVEAQEAATIGIHFDASNVKFDGFFSTTTQEKDTIKSQKKWLPANFRVKLGDMPASRVTKVAPVLIGASPQDINGDGGVDFVISEEIEVTMPIEDATVLYNKWFLPDDPAAPTLKTLEIEYLDADGLRVFDFEVPVSIEATGFANLFLGDIATPGREISVCFRARGIVTKKPGSGTAG